MILYTYTIYKRQFSKFVNPTRTIFAEAQIPQIGGNPAVYYRDDNNVVTLPSMYRMILTHSTSISL